MNAGALDEPPLDQGIVAILARMRDAGIPAFSAGSPNQARAVVAAGRAGLGPGAAMRACRQVEIPTRSGAIGGTLLVPEGGTVGLCVYMHGGGWVIGTPGDYEVLGRALARESGCAVLLPDYRLAPEHPFPAGLEDTQDALIWASQVRGAIIGGGKPLVAAGDSAGANLLTVAAHRLCGRVALAGQVLIYPVTDCDPGTGSYQRHGAGLPLTRADMDWFFGHYAPPALWPCPAVAPLREADLTRLPPTVVAVASHDILHDEGVAYARRLAEAGRLAALRRYAGATHGFIRLHNLVDTAGRAVTELAGDLRGFCLKADVAARICQEAADAQG